MTNETAMPGGIQTAEEFFPWWIVLLNGIIALILGIVLLVWPLQTLVILVTFLGVFWLISGIFGIISIFIDRSRWVWKLVLGILGILAGGLILAYPFYSTVLIPSTFAIIFGVWGIIYGIVALIQGFSGGGWGTGLIGIISIIFGLIIVANPLASAVALIFIAAIFGIIGGIAAIILSFRLR